MKKSNEQIKDTKEIDEKITKAHRISRMMDKVIRAKQLPISNYAKV